MLDGNAIVDRKDNILELYKDFAGSQNRESYENAALLTQMAGKQLVYVIGTTPDNRVEQISDLCCWQFTIKNQTFIGTHLYQQVLRHQAMYPHISFVFAKRETIFYKGIMPSEKVLDFPVDCNFLTGSVNL